MQRRALLTDGSLEEGRHEVVVASGDLCLHEGSREPKALLVDTNDLLRMLKALDHLIVVDAEHREPMRLCVQIGPRLEVGDDTVRLKRLDEVEVRTHLTRQRSQSVLDVLP